MAYHHPLAYLLGLEGIALLRAFAGEYGREFTEARFAEVRALLDAADRFGPGATVQSVSIQEGYRNWADSYDQPGNQLIELEQSIVWDILDGLPVGTAADVGCGTGRHAARLASLGHRVIGVDTSADMLVKARAKVPAGEFYQADLHRLPLPDRHVDVLVCALALAHVPDLATAMKEFVRVLRPGGHLVISDPRGLIGDIDMPLLKAGPNGDPGFVPNRSRLASDYLSAALPLGLRLRRCEEPRRPAPFVGADGRPPHATGPVPDHVPGGPPNIWALHPWCVDAVNAAYRDTPAAIVCHFELGDG
ncbi:class I SAM-dependent methyltransferase [Phytoactinopolyspora halotolerans]|uniref:Class I SAM-dependent methyltransferase n=2 Tax=Phytoactinopolyspora halotolerans TaxID=1981512 RepID=A0A6L9S7M7_9ACTN|nr:class I SAM-dependent methyltransferase [Phytoactinopolyspora halotolerans]